MRPIWGKQLHIRVSDSCHEGLLRLANVQETTVSDLVRRELSRLARFDASPVQSQAVRQLPLKRPQ